jgi:hypothetical protein
MDNDYAIGDSSAAASSRKETTISLQICHETNFCVLNILFITGLGDNG